jgi:hypothetical protein
MSKSVLASLIFSFLLSSSFAQSLLPHIGVDSPPALSDEICDIPIVDGNFEEAGFFPGDAVPDFTLYNTDGEPRQLSHILSSGKHAMIINGSYSCWRFRDEIEVMNQIAELFGDHMETLIVYSVEAHPHIDLSPYSGTLSTGARNFSDSVLLRQPTTYGERMENIDFMLERHTVIPDILLDGPCNEWWLNYGTAANHAYLIDPAGIVQLRHTWFNQPPYDIECELTEYFELPTPGCAEPGTFGQFDIEISETHGTHLTGLPGETIMVPVTIENLSATDFVFVDILRENVDVPEGWLTSLCVDICLAPSVDQTTAAIPPGETQSFTFYFFTNENTGTGYGEVRFRNESNEENMAIISFSATAQEETIITDISSTDSPEFVLFPNPAGEWLHIQGNSMTATPWIIADVSGRVIDHGQLNGERTTIEVSHLPRGIYFLRPENGKPVRFVKR